nr:MAG TPA: outer capsid protein sigma-1 attachment protein [Caudoviricetes sp.]
MNRILELSSKSSKGGRRKIRMVLLTLHKKDEKNLNGISWNEEYVLNNLDSIKGIPICASFVDSELKDIPLDHGYTETVEIGDGKSEPLFNNSECCGVIEDAKIEDLEINGEIKRVLVGYGYLFYQRYKNFCDYLKENILLSDVKSSIEIVGKNGGSIIYDGGYNKELRYPQVFDFSATAILGGVVKEADENCYVLEVAQKQEKLKEEKKNMEFDKKEFEEVLKSTLAEINSEKKSHDDEVSELNNKITELNSQIEAKDADIAARDTQIAELNAKVEQMEKDMKKKDDEKEDLEKEVTKAKASEKLSEVEAALKDFSDEEKEVAKEDIKKLKDEINACKKKSELNNVTSEINSIKSKICMEIVAKQKQAESEARISEQNSEEVKIEDIFSEVCSEKYVDDDEEVNIF